MFEYWGELKIQDFVIGADGSIKFKYKYSKHIMIVCCAQGWGGCNSISSNHPAIKQDLNPICGCLWINCNTSVYLCQLLGITKYPTVFVMHRETGERIKFNYTNDLTRPTIVKWATNAVSTLNANTPASLSLKSVR